MDLRQIKSKVFGNTLDDFTAVVFHDDIFLQNLDEEQKLKRRVPTKKNALLTINEQINDFCEALHFEDDIIFKDDLRYGRVGNSTVYFVFDRSYGIMSVSQNGLNLTSACRFATISASCGVYAGKWMYEVHLSSNEIMQIGWCSNKCSFSIDRGCGDTNTSYAYDGYRRRTWNMVSETYGESWKIGDVIGVCINLDNKTIEYYRNGSTLGVAFTDIRVGKDFMYFPCLSLADTQTVYANFGGRPFRYPVEMYSPLQQQPVSKIHEAKYVLEWINNLTDIVYPSEPKVITVSDSDISDNEFWNRFYSSLCYPLSNTLVDSFCTFHNFLPFLEKIGKAKDGISNKDDHGKLMKILDECWINIKPKYIEKAFYNIFHYLVLLFKEIGQTINSKKHSEILTTCQLLISHINTRKFFISSFLFDTVDVFILLHHRPFDQKCFDEFIGDVWWDTKGFIPAIEERKASFAKAYEQVENYFNELEIEQCNFAKLIITNSDGNEDSPSSRAVFLRKLRKYFWRELDLFRNEIISSLPTSGAYAFFLRFTLVLEDLWKTEVGDEQLKVPANMFYDHTMKYNNCERIGGIEPFLFRQMRDEINAQLNGNIDSTSVSAQNSGTMPIIELRNVRGFNEIVSFFNDNENTFETISLPLPSLNSPVVHAIFAPFYVYVEKDEPTGNLENKHSLLELFEDLIMFLTSTTAKHCKKIYKTMKVFEQYIQDYNIVNLQYEKLKDSREQTDPIFASLGKSIELQRVDLEKRARKCGWIKYVLINPPKYSRFVLFFEALIATIVAAEAQGELFAFLPDFYLEACSALTAILVKDFGILKPFAGDENCEKQLCIVADFSVHIMNDKRIKNIDSKKIPANIIATFATTPASMNILNCLDEKRSKELIQKLLIPYSDRVWTTTNWIVVRFWHGNGFGFRYTSLPHHSSVPDYSKILSMYNIGFCPSEYYQGIIRQHLLNREENIPGLLDSMISELHWIFGEFLATSQELQRSIEKNEHMIMTTRHYKSCTSNFDRTIALLRVFDMFMNLAPEVFLQSYYNESTSYTKRIIQIVLLIVNRIASHHGCFRTVINARLPLLENVEYFPIASASTAILLNVLRGELDHFKDDNMVVTPFCKMVLIDPNYDFNSLEALIGTQDEHPSRIISLHDYDDIMQDHELEMARKLLHVLSNMLPLISKTKAISDDEICTICYASPFDVKFEPCGHTSCLACVSYHIKKSRLCFFCKRAIRKVIDIETGVNIPELDDVNFFVLSTEN